MKAFEFNFTGYEAKRNGNTLFVWELDSQGDRLNISPLEITVSDLYMLIDESERLQAFHNPTCTEVSAARTELENARDRRPAGGEGGGAFDLALELYTDVLARHREASTCRVFH